MNTCKDLEFIYGKINSIQKYDCFDDYLDAVTPLTPSCVFEAKDSFGNSECRKTRCHNFKLNKYGIFCELAKDCRLVINTKRNHEEQKYFEIYSRLDDTLLYKIQSTYDEILSKNS